jgi:hypothetical protein
VTRAFWQAQIHKLAPQPCQQAQGNATISTTTATKAKAIVSEPSPAGKPSCRGECLRYADKPAQHRKTMLLP